MSGKGESLETQIETEIIIEGESEDSKPLSRRIEKSKTRQKSYSLDLRIHSPESLGYMGIQGIDTAPALVRLAKVKGLDVIAVTDFFSSTFVDRLMAAAQNSEVTVILGVTIRCSVDACDDVVLLCLFPDGYTGAGVEQFLKDLGIPASAYGNHRYVLKKSLSDILKITDKHHALVIPSRMDKTPHRLQAIPALIEQYGFRTFDLAYTDSVALFKRRWPKIKFNLFSFSNANALAQVGSRRSKVKLQVPGFEGLKQLINRDAVR